MPELTHFDDSGAARMVDVGPKPETERMARASAVVHMQTGTLALIRDRKAAKGDVLEIARLAGIMGAKRTADLIPLCHPLPLTSIAVSFSFPTETALRIEAIARVFARTGVEMEALTAVTVAALTVYDMCKAVDRAIVVSDVRLEEKDGGKSGRFVRDAAAEPMRGEG
jgi:cyclic pyranopterin phosphate synthase